MNFLIGRPNARWMNEGLMFLRVVTGAIFAIHGYGKMFKMGLSGTATMFAHIGAPLPGFTGPLFGICEVVFGVAVIFGLITRLGAVWFILDMLGAISVVHIKNGWSGQGGLEFPVLLLAASVTLLVAGPGAFAIDNLLVRRTRTGGMNGT